MSIVRITHFGHACVVIETDVAKLLIDPGTLASGFEDVADLDAVLVTHQHADHLDVGRLPALLARNPRARLCVDAGSAAAVTVLGLAPIVVAPGQRLAVGGSIVEVVGGEHAVVHPRIPAVPNAAYLIDAGAFYHPGDSFFLPGQDIDVLAVPTSGPWLKLGEAIDFVRAAGPRLAMPIHEAALASTRTHHGYLADMVAVGTTFFEPRRGESTQL